MRFDNTYAAFLLTNLCNFISLYIVGSPVIFWRLGVRKSVRTPLTLLVVPTMMSLTLVGIDDGFVPWEHSSNLLKS